MFAVESTEPIERMKVFTLSIFKGHELKHQKDVTANSQEDLNNQKKIFWDESPYKKGANGNWMGVKRIR
jgi:hypothetical protein